MIRKITFLLAILFGGQCRPQSQTSPTLNSGEHNPYLYVPERQQYYQYDFPLQAPQYYNFPQNRPVLPRDQPQIVLYHGGAAPGQPFLLQPGPPPGNFLVPQPNRPGPNVILRDSPQPPIFVAGYPKPAHIPPIEKDAEEIPTNPARIPPMTPAGRKPEKLETFNEPVEKKDKKPATESENLPEGGRSPFNTRANLSPGQRFFILNGQSLFDYPFQNPGLNLKYPQPGDALYRNAITGQFDDIATSRENYPENLVLLNSPESFQAQDYAKSAFPLLLNVNRDPIFPENSQFADSGSSILGAPLPGSEANQDSDDSVVIDARDKVESSGSQTQADPESEAGNGPEKSGEPTIAQAQPGAIALAGPGGVAAAAPRGTAFVGNEGVAVSSPQATAIAGPSKSESGQKSRKRIRGKQN